MAMENQRGSLIFKMEVQGRLTTLMIKLMMTLNKPMGIALMREKKPMEKQAIANKAMRVHTP
jgi:hypothetical protein